MDNRRIRRQDTNLCVVISYRRVGLISCRARDVSTEGMQVEVGVVSVPKGAYVRVHATIRGAGHHRTFSSGAWIAWCADGKMGLVFDQPQPQLYAAFHEQQGGVPRPVAAPGGRAGCGYRPVSRYPDGRKPITYWSHPI